MESFHTPGAAPLDREPAPHTIEIEGPGHSVGQTYGSYAAPAPAGVGIDAVNGMAGSDGQGQHLVDIENGWTVDHVSLLAHGLVAPAKMQGSRRSHGTAVLGIACGKPAGLEPQGLAPQAIPHVFSAVDSIAGALESAMKAVPAPAVLLLTRTTLFSTTNLPAEGRKDVYDVVVRAVKAGYVVIESAGNGSDLTATSVNLDQYTHTTDDERGQFILRRPGSRGDSGAIVVGAVDPLPFGPNGSGHKVFRSSNFGQRVDCYAWGASVRAPTSSLISPPPAPPAWSTNAYADFGETSAAAPIIAGIVLVLQGIRAASGQAPLTPAAIRSLLSNPANGTPVYLPDGVTRASTMPDLQKIVALI